MSLQCAKPYKELGHQVRLALVLALEKWLDLEEKSRISTE
jgi:hypothetical protein